MFWVILLSCLAGLLAAVAGARRVLRARGMDRWLGTYVRDTSKRRARTRGRAASETHVLIGVMDHFEPQWGNPPAAQAWARVESWVEGYPRLFGQLRDSDGRSPRHSFFFPIDEYHE